MTRPTVLTIRQARRDILHQALLKTPELERIEDLRSVLPYFENWRDDVLADAVHDCAEAGLISEAADGRLCVRLRRPAA
jgi:hypothetical protein